MRYLGTKKLKVLKENEIINKTLEPDLNSKLAYLDQLLKDCSDVVVRRFRFGRYDTEAALLYFDGLTSKSELEDTILRPLMLEYDLLPDVPETTRQDLLANARDRLLITPDIAECCYYHEVITRISSGDAVLLIDGYETALALGTKSWEKRSMESPDQEVVIRGPKEAFTETLRFNTALIRRRIKSSRLKMEKYVLGSITQTDVVMCYIKGLAPEEIVDEVRRRIQAINIDGVLDTGYLEEFMEDHRFTFFPQVEQTERPDRVAAHLLEGRVALMVDGTPWAMVVPTTFPMFWASPEDYYSRYVPASFLRVLRIMAFLLSLLLPALYVATVSFHQEMIPTPLLLTIAASREGIPFPTIVEALMMEVTFELLREAGLRMPRAIGPAISIVGGLVIGDAAVSAGLVSPIMVVIVAFTGICSFITPSYNAGMALRLARFPLLLASAFLGYLGIMICLLLILTHAASMSSFGVPYLAPLTPFNLQDIKDVLVRKPWWAPQKRPHMFSELDSESRE